MADIDSIISGVSGNTRYDFSTFGDPVKSYQDAQDRRARNELRDAFKGGVPTLPDGSIDYGSMQRTLYQKGGFEQGNSLSGISARAGELEALRGADGPQSPPTVGPSTSRNTVTIDPTKRADASTPPPQAAPPSQQPTVMTIMAAQGFPNSDLQKISESVARQLGVDPTAPLDMKDPQVRNVLVPAIAQIKRMNLGQTQPPQPGDNPPQAPVVAQAQPQQGFQPPPNVVAAQNDPVLKRLTLLAASQDKSVAEAARIRLKDYQERMMPTGPLKEYQAAVSQGFKGTFEDWQNRGDENKSQQAVLTDLILPELKTSKEGASAAKTEIQSMHKAREQLDASGGIFTGTMAQQRLKLAKAAELFGIPNTDKITNTEAFVSAMGAKVVASLKALGVNPSNKDLAFAEKMAGSPELSETSLRRILDIGEQAARDKIERHNSTVGQYTESTEAVKPYAKALRVDAPGTYKKTQQATGASATFSSPADVRAAIAAGNLKKGDTFTDGNGTQRVVP